MEGMPKLPMIAPEFKFSDVGLPNEFFTSIKEYILLHYQDDPSRYENAFSELQVLRGRFSRIMPDLEVANQMKRYYAQMLLLKNRFPMEEGDPLRVPFSWVEKAIDIPSVNTYEDVNYELACVLHNIGVVYAVLAANESRGDMGAQAQECMLEKSLIDHRKNVVIAKLAAYLKDIYAHCCQNLEASSLNDMISSSSYNEKLRSCDIKSEIYGAIMMVELGEQADMEKKMGHRLAYYQLAEEHVKSAFKILERCKLEGFRQSVLFLNDIVSAKASNARKENGFIYHERVPKVEELEFVESVCMVKPISFDPTDPEVAGEDLFASLLPMNVLKAVSIYSEKKADMKRSIVDRVEAKDKELDAYLSSLKLDEISFTGPIGAMKLPDMLLERSAAFNSQPDSFPDLLDKLQRVGKCVIEADHKLDDLTRRLSVIDSQDLVNDVGFIAIKNELGRVTEHHAKARVNNVELQKALASHSENLKLLAMPLEELSRLVVGSPVDFNETEEGLKLRKILDKVNELRKQRISLIDQFTKDLENDDVTRKCLTFKDSDNKELFESELDKHKQSLKYIDLNLSAQDTILNALTEANANFAEYRKKLVKLNESKAEQILSLTTAYDVYADVLRKADDGLKFYAKLASLTNSLSEAIDDKEERKNKSIENNNLEERMRNLRPVNETNESDPQSSTGIKPRLDSSNHRSGDVKDNYYLNYYRNKTGDGVLMHANGNQRSSIPVSSLPSSISSGLRSGYGSTIRKPLNEQVSSVGLPCPSFQPPLPVLSNYAVTMPPSQPAISHYSGFTSTVQPSTVSNQMTPRFASRSLPYVERPYSTNMIGGPAAAIASPTFLSSSQSHDTNALIQKTPLNTTNARDTPTSIIGNEQCLKMANNPLLNKTLLFENAGREIVSPNSANERLRSVQFSGMQPASVIPPTIPASTMPHDGGMRDIAQNNFAHSSGRVAPNVSPWHQSLYTNRSDVSVASRLIHTEPSNTQLPQLKPQTSVYSGLASQRNDKFVLRSRAPSAMDDLMSVPLGSTLPTPLLPVSKQVGSVAMQPTLPNITNANEHHLKASAPSQRSLVFTTSQEREIIPLTSSVVVREEARKQKAEAIVPPVVRPAATVAPIVQATVTSLSTSDAVLGMTNVISLSYSGCSLDQMTVDENNTRRNQISPLNELGDRASYLHKFPFGEVGCERIEKRERELNCQGSLLNSADPLNRIDAHYWIRK